MVNWDAVAAISSAFSSVSVVLALLEVKRSQMRELSSFEDSISREYREIMERIPVHALLGRHVEINNSNREILYSVFYRYFDLCNEQAFLASKGRIRPETWAEWQDGIRSNLRKPAFKMAWLEMQKDLDEHQDFRGLSHLIEEFNVRQLNIPSLPAG